MSAVRTVKVSNVSLSATEQDIKEFFSFSGDIEHVEMKSGDEWSQVAHVVFKDKQGAETAILLSGATIVDLSVIITLDAEYQLPPSAASTPVMVSDSKSASGAAAAAQKAEDVVSTMLAKGFILGKDALNKARALDEKHQFSSTATAKVASFDKRIGLSQKITMGTSAVNEKVKEMDQKFQVSEKTKLAFSAAEQKVSNAGSTIMKNRYVLTGTSWVTGAFSKVAKAATDVGSMTKDKVAAEEKQQKGLEGELAQVRISEDTKAASSEIPRSHSLPKV
ncbi:hypothetical protein HPP92_021791 [Vanilla planifolia]|uniref:RRM domain-containing protein n=1 Tax=Vanilla planifolia TaxID=51239 RepID=A0A835PRD1_VANPL|nr:hypothetical protein HPP92_022133 [Vanilla planifolia]KAG0458663.1 hypothetical protein HPP92_021791 [Vanilla planifolia]